MSVDRRLKLTVEDASGDRLHIEELTAGEPELSFQTTRGKSCVVGREDVSAIIEFLQEWAGLVAGMSEPRDVEP